MPWRAHSHSSKKIRRSAISCPSGLSWSCRMTSARTSLGEVRTRCCVDPETQGRHDALDHVEDRLLPLKQTVRHPLDPPTTALKSTVAQGVGEAARDAPRPSANADRRTPDGSPRPTCASTATRWPRTPTTVTPVTFPERTWGKSQPKLRRARRRASRNPTTRDTPKAILNHPSPGSPLVTWTIPVATTQMLPKHNRIRSGTYFATATSPGEGRLGQP